MIRETLIKFKKTKIILADGGAFVGDHANVKPIADTRDKRVEAQRQRLDGSAAIQPIRLNIANRAVKQIRKIIFGILKSAFPNIKIDKDIQNMIKSER